MIRDALALPPTPIGPNRGVGTPEIWAFPHEYYSMFDSNRTVPNLTRFRR
jgi:hypothetical protein